MHAYADIIGVNAGKQWMRRRKPVNVKSFSILHNAVMFFASLYMVIETLRQVGRAPFRNTTSHIRSDSQRGTQIHSIIRMFA